MNHTSPINQLDQCRELRSLIEAKQAAGRPVKTLSALLRSRELRAMTPYQDQLTKEAYRLLEQHKTGSVKLSSKLVARLNARLGRG